MSAIKIYYNDSLWIVMWDHRPPGRFAPHDKICDILRAAIKSRISADMLSLRIWYSVIIHITYSLLHKCNFFQMLMQINRSNWGHLQKGALCPMLLYVHYFNITLKTVLPHGVGQTAPYLGQHGPLTVFESESSMIHNFHIYFGLQCWITYLP